MIRINHIYNYFLLALYLVIFPLLMQHEYGTNASFRNSLICESPNTSINASYIVYNETSKVHNTLCANLPKLSRLANLVVLICGLYLFVLMMINNKEWIKKKIKEIENER